MILLAAVALAGCGDQFGPQAWDPTPQAVRLWSIDRPELIGLPSAYDFVSERRVVVESPGEAANWDITLTDSGAGLAFRPAGAYPDIDSHAGIATIDDQSFEELNEAPRSSAVYTDSAAVALEVGKVLVVRTRRFPYFGRVCQRYAKLEVLEVDTASGEVLFHFTRNPNCNNRSLVPPDDD